MSDPKRLLEDPSCLAVDRAVLLSACGDAASDRARRATQLSLGLTLASATPTLAAAGAATTATVTATTKVATWLTALKIGGAVVVSGVAIAAGGMALRSVEASRPSIVPTVVPSARAVAPEDARQKSEIAEPKVASTPVESLPDVPSFGHAAKRSAPPAASANAADAPATSRMTEELAMLDRARLRLASGDAAGALADLGAYDRVHPGGALAREASILRVDAHLELGDKAAARREAKTYVDRYPTSPAAPRLRKLIGEVDQAEK